MAQHPLLAGVEVSSPRAPARGSVEAPAASVRTGSSGAALRVLRHAAPLKRGGESGLRALANALRVLRHAAPLKPPRYRRTPCKGSASPRAPARGSVEAPRRAPRPRTRASRSPRAPARGSVGAPVWMSAHCYSVCSPRAPARGSVEAAFRRRSGREDRRHSPRAPARGSVEAP